MTNLLCLHYILDSCKCQELILFTAKWYSVNPTGCTDSSVLCKTITCVTQSDSGLFVRQFWDLKQSCCGCSQKGRTVRCHLEMQSQQAANASVSYITQALWGWHSLWLKCTVGDGPLILMLMLVFRCGTLMGSVAAWAVVAEWPSTFYHVIVRVLH